MLRKWFITGAVILMLGATLLVGVRSMQPAKAASPSPLYLQQIGVIGSDYTAHTSYHRGSQIELWADFYDLTGQSIVYTAHPAVYHSSYRLLNVAVGYTSWASIGTQQASWWVTIPKNAPLGTYKYWFTLIVFGYPNQTLLTTFTVVK